MKEKSNKGVQIVIIVAVVILFIAVAVDIVLNYVPLKDIFSQNINYTTSKEVTVTDEGIADAVEKLYDATVIVEIGQGNNLSGWGSGFVYRQDDDYAYILTNHHVVEDADSVTIVFTDESEVEGEVVGSDEYTDVAVVRVPSDSILKVAEIGTTEDMRVGDTIFAIGTPVGLEYSFTVTRGILSGKNRMVEMTSSSSNSIFQQSNSESWYMNLLQIDASINSGNSGGPLANCNGEVIGITNSKLSSAYSSTSIENMGFAIPIEDAMNIANQLEESGSVVRPVLGVTMTTVEGARYNNINLDDSIESGAVVVSVENGSSAADAGLEKGDVITKIGEYEVEDYMYLKYYLYRYQVGDKVEITYIRDGKTRTTEVTLED